MKTKQRAFLKAFVRLGSVAAACAAAKMGRRTHYDWMKDEAYASDFEAAREDAAELLESAAWKRATRSKKPSDLLLIFLLKGLKPEKYRDTWKGDLNLSGSIDLVERLTAARKRVQNCSVVPIDSPDFPY